MKWNKWKSWISEGENPPNRSSESSVRRGKSCWNGVFDFLCIRYAEHARWRTCLARAGHGAYLAAQCHGHEAPKGSLRGKLEGGMTCMPHHVSSITIPLSENLCVSFLTCQVFQQIDVAAWNHHSFLPTFEEWTRHHEVTQIWNMFFFTEDNDGSLSLAEFQKAFELLATSPTSSHKLRWQQTSVMGIDLAVAPQELSIKSLGWQALYARVHKGKRTPKAGHKHHQPCTSSPLEFSWFSLPQGEWLAHIFKMADIDSNGLLNFPEFVAVARQYQKVTNGWHVRR